MQSLLRRTTTFVTQPATFFVRQMKKKLSKTKTTHIFIQQKNDKQSIKSKCLPNCIYSFDALWFKVYLQTNISKN